MKKDPKIVNVDQIDNAALVQFAGEAKPAVYPARLLHAAKDMGEIMMEQDLEEALEEKVKS
jgi:hypothetical protein